MESDVSVPDAQPPTSAQRVPVLRFKQWLAEWDAYDFDASAFRRKPEEFVYLFSMRAAELRVLCDVYKRERVGPQAEGIQRARDDSRTARIQRYVRYGYPFGDLKSPLQSEPANLPLRKPGWLPTAIVVNILTADDRRRGRSVAPEQTIRIVEDGPAFALEIPAMDEPPELAPLEVIDGQHRLWAFDELEGEEPIPDDFELPVVAFRGLDVAWQAYLFWSINVSPKKINPSHAFDLYPLLRSQDWLDRVGELTVYREARAQELTDILFSHPDSPWRGRINMLGERGQGGVSQAAWIRALLTSFLAVGRGRGRPGLFQADIEETQAPLAWSRAQQAAFLIVLWEQIWRAAESGAQTHFWLRVYGSSEAALTHRSSMINQDQGVRAILAVANDIFFESAAVWQLDRWRVGAVIDGATSLEEIDEALTSLRGSQISSRLNDLAQGLVTFDWRSLDGPEVEGEDQVRKRSYRGSGGYSALRLDVLETLALDRTALGRTAKMIADREIA